MVLSSAAVALVVGSLTRGATLGISILNTDPVEHPGYSVEVVLRDGELPDVYPPFRRRVTHVVQDRKAAHSDRVDDQARYLRVRDIPREGQILRWHRPKDDVEIAEEGRGEEEILDDPGDDVGSSFIVVEVEASDGHEIARGPLVEGSDDKGCSGGGQDTEVEERPGLRFLQTGDEEGLAQR